MDIVFMVPSKTFLFNSGRANLDDKLRVGIYTSSYKSAKRFSVECCKAIPKHELSFDGRRAPDSIIVSHEVSLNRVPIDELRLACQQLAKSQGVDLCEDEDIVRMACGRWTKSILESTGIPSP